MDETEKRVFVWRKKSVKARTSSGVRDDHVANFTIVLSSRASGTQFMK
jgi:hypothetical protein